MLLINYLNTSSFFLKFLITISNSKKWKSHTMEEQAKKELEMLEAQYPNQFEYLKQELRSFIFQQQDYHSLLFPQNDNHVNTATNVFLDTEESTSLEHSKKSNCGIKLALVAEKEKEEVKGKKTCESSELDSPKSVVMTHYPSRKNKRKDRVDLVIERAQNCLKKIRLFKLSLLSSS